MTPVTHSPEMGKLAAAICKVQVAVEPIVKDQEVETENYVYTYANLASVWLACRAQLGAVGVAVFQPCQAEGSRVVVTTILVHAESGEWLRSEMEIIAAGSNAQAVGSAVSYARRYALTSSLGLVTREDDDDGQRAQAAPAPQTRAPVPADRPPTYEQIGEMIAGAQSTKGLAAIVKRWVEPEAGENKDHPLRITARARYKVLAEQEKAAAGGAA